jgi:hypothetical protein
MANLYSTYTRTIPAGGFFQYSIGQFKFLRVLESTQVNLEDISIAFPSGQYGFIAAGIAVELSADDPYFQLVNNTAGDIALTIGISTGRILDDRFTAVNTIAVKDVGSVLDDIDATSIASGAVATIAANTSLRDIGISNHSVSSALYARSGANGGVALAGGIIIPPNGTVFINNTAAIYVHNTSGGAISYSYMGSE